MLLVRTSVVTSSLHGLGLFAVDPDVAIYRRTPEALTGPDEIVVFERAGHFPHREQPEDSACKLLRFLGPANSPRPDR